MNFFQAEKGGSGGVNNYPDLSNKPQINGVELSGNQTAAQLGLAPAGLNLSGITKVAESYVEVGNSITVTLPNNTIWDDMCSYIWIFHMGQSYATSSDPKYAMAIGSVHGSTSDIPRPFVLIKKSYSGANESEIINSISATTNSLTININAYLTYLNLEVYRI